MHLVSARWVNSISEVFLWLPSFGIPLEPEAAPNPQLHAGSQQDAEEAASLAKADLATSLVMEMTALAGVMGRHYALKQGRRRPVAEVGITPYC